MRQELADKFRNVFEWVMPTDVSHLSPGACTKPTPDSTTITTTPAPSIRIYAGQIFRFDEQRGEASRVWDSKGRVEYLTDAERREIVAAGLDLAKAAKAKPYFAQLLSTAQAAAALSKVGGLDVRGYKERTLDPYWAAFARAERVEAGSPSPTEAEW